MGNESRLRKCRRRLRRRCARGLSQDCRLSLSLSSTFPRSLCVCLSVSRSPCPNAVPPPTRVRTHIKESSDGQPKRHEVKVGSRGVAPPRSVARKWCREKKRAGSIFAARAFLYPRWRFLNAHLPLSVLHCRVCAWQRCFGALLRSWRRLAGAFFDARIQWQREGVILQTQKLRHISPRFSKETVRKSPIPLDDPAYVHV